jgi:hypothetical protein
MNPGPEPRIRILPQPRAGLLVRILYGALGLVVLVAAFFFVGIALVAGAILAAAIALRWWWLRRRIARARQADVVEGEYRVIEAAISDRQPDRGPD